MSIIAKGHLGIHVNFFRRVLGLSAAQGRERGNRRLSNGLMFCDIGPLSGGILGKKFSRAA
jgi:hypothetical protein